MKKISLLFCIAIFLFASCRDRVLEYPLFFEGEKLVVFGFFTANEPFKVTVSKTWPPAGVKPSETNINDAEVIIQKDGVFLEKLSFTENGIYVSKNNTKVSVGAKYQVFVNSKSLGKVESKVVEVPSNKANFSYQKTKNIKPERNADINQDLITLKISETKVEKVYYYISFQTLYSKEQNSAQFWKNGEVNGLKRDDCGFGTSVYFDKVLNNALVFTNDCFIDKQKQFDYSLELGFNTSVDNKSVFVTANKINIRVARISKDYFDYLKNQFQPIDVERIFRDPTTNFTNIKGGYGIIATANETIESYNP